MNLFAFSSVLICFTNISIAIFVLSKGKNERVNIIWALLCIFVSFWGIGSYKFSTVATKEEAVFWWQIANIGAILIPVTYYHFLFNFLKLKKKYQKYILLAAYISGFIFLTFNLFIPKYFIGDLKLVFNQFYIVDFSSKNPVYFYFYVLFYLMLLLYSFTELIISYMQSKGIIKNQLKLFILASIIGWIGGDGYFLTVINNDIYPFLNFAIAIYPLIITYAIFRYRLMDIYLAIKRTAAYSLAAGLLTAFFAILVITATNLLSSAANISSLKISIVAALIIAILFNPLRNRIQSLIDKVFYKKTYDYYATIGKVGKEMESLFDLDKIYNFVGEIVFSTLGLENIHILSVSSASGNFDTVYHLSKKDRSKKDKSKSETTSESDDETEQLDSSSELIKFITKYNVIIVKDELSSVGKGIDNEIIERVKNDFKGFDGEAVVPVFVDKKFELLLILGGKLSGDMFTTEDINLLNTISNQTATAIKNAGLYKDKVESERMASIGMMAATFAHEVRNPLTSLKTFAQLMPEKYNDEEFRNYFAKIVEGEIDKIDGLIRDLLDFSTEKKSSRSNNYNLVSLVDETVNYVKGKLDFEKKNIYIEKNYGNNVIEMSGDATNLKQAFINIITNGCQAMNGEGTLKVHINPNGELMEVAITDTGDGIHPDDISKIFDPFVTTKEMGIGLGLAISKRIVEDHKGSIKVKSQLSKGTTFTISLPVQN